MSTNAPQPADLTPSLVIRLRNGDSEAAKMLEAIHGPAILRFCMGYLHDVIDAQDAVQEVFVQTLRSDVVPDHFRAWLYRVARNHCLKVLRTRRRKPPPGDLPPESVFGEDVTGNLTRMARDELHQRLNNLVAALPDTQSEVLRLRYAENLSRDEIAEILEIPVSVVKSRLYEAMKKLREHPSLLTDL
ncbi:MAG: sigma-70 family RNA polymerase sigma factor [Planctomycetes bacterium]|nr:sigma-70 family RNA polymerase sigma factor [Planctomycetota bacterium]